MKFEFPQKIKVPVIDILKASPAVTLDFGEHMFVSAENLATDTIPIKTRRLLLKEGILPVINAHGRLLALIAPPRVVYQESIPEPTLYKVYEAPEKVLDTVQKVADLVVEEYENMFGETRLAFKWSGVPVERLYLYYKRLFKRSKALLRAYLYITLTYGATYYIFTKRDENEVVTAKGHIAYLALDENDLVIRVPVYILPLSKRHQPVYLLEYKLSHNLQVLELKRVKKGILHLGLKTKCKNCEETYDIRFFKIKDAKRVTSKPVNPRRYLLKKFPRLRGKIYMRKLFEYTSGSKVHIYKVSRVDAPHDWLIREERAIIIPLEPLVLAETMFYKFEIEDERKL